MWKIAEKSFVTRIVNLTNICTASGEAQTEGGAVSSYLNRGQKGSPTPNLNIDKMDWSLWIRQSLSYTLHQTQMHLLYRKSVVCQYENCTTLTDLQFILFLASLIALNATFGFHIYFDVAVFPRKRGMKMSDTGVSKIVSRS